jgi:ATP-dependent helicase HrpB
LPYNPLNIDLPIVSILNEVTEKLISQNTLIITAPPGAGKSTVLPLALLSQVWLNQKKIIMLEPRRLAAKSIAYRMASLLDEEVGNTVGYRVRFENRVSNKSKIVIVTEGILTRMLQNDNALEEIGLVIFDEFHERNLNADLALALCKQAQQILRPDLRIIIMSATLNMAQLSNVLSAPVIESKGRQFDVDVIYTSDADETLLPELTARTVIKAINDNEGDVLVFLPGEGEIKKCDELLRKQLSNISIHPLYSMLPQNEQYLAIMPNKFGKRKIVLATSIAETSLTIEGIKIVIDCGFMRTSRFDTKSGLSRLETVRVSKDMADQRAGRAGRLSNGVCYRMWTKATHERLALHRVPEIMEADLTSLTLDLAKWGVDDIEKLTWLTPPPKSAITQSTETLHQINALENNRITTHGKLIHSLACHPRIAHMLIRAKEINMVQLASDIAAVIEERDPMTRDTGIDINLRIEALRRARNNSTNNIRNRFARIEKIAAFYRKMFNVEVDNNIFDVYDSGILLAYAYPERIAFARPGNNAQFQLANGKLAMAGHNDDLAHEPWLSVAHMDLRDGMGKIFLAAPLNPKDLLPMVKEYEVVNWDTRKGGLISSTELRIGSIVLQSKQLVNINQEQVLDVISNTLKTEGENLLDFDENMQQLQNRILSLRIWNPNETWPDVSTSELLNTTKTWLGICLTSVRKAEDLKKINLAEALFNSLDWEKQQLLNKLAPKKIQVPSGSEIKIQYFSNGSIPVLSVRLQEIFGLSDTPKLNNEKISLVMHLLSPGYKPVQITSDLKSFWNNMYFEVKKEMQRKYPKHSWPDNPYTSKAVAKGSSYKK